MDKALQRGRRNSGEEGFEEIAVQFKEIAEVEEQHEKRYRKLLKADYSRAKTGGQNV